MLTDAFKALSQILSPPMRKILWRSVGLALVLITVVAIALQRGLSWLATYGEVWAEGMLGPSFSTPLSILEWIISIAAAVSIIVGAVFLMPAITALVASVFVDDVADEVEREHYPADKPGTALPIARALTEGGKTALLAIGLYLIALPFFFFAGIGVVVFFLLAAFLLGREYFLLAAMRFRPADKARLMRKDHSATIFLYGCVVAAFVSIPIVNLATPLFGTALMVHLHKRLSGRQTELLEPAGRPALRQ